MIGGINGTTHYSFSDVSTLLEAVGQSTAPFEGLLGMIEPKAMVRILTAFTSEWMRGIFDGEGGTALLGDLEMTDFPEVKVDLQDDL